MLLLQCSMIYIAQAQKQYYIWHFGDHAGLDFNYSPPKPITGSIKTSEGSSSMADPVTGQLLFYTDGVTVWNRNHVPMPGSIATPLNGGSSSTQSALIVPKPGSSALYYIFTTMQMDDYSWGGKSYTLRYSIVDMRLNNGYGDLISVNNILLDTSTEKLAAVGNNNCSAFWIMGHQWESNIFWAFKLTASGISQPVKSQTGVLHHTIGDGSIIEATGYLKFSPNGKKLGAVVNSYSNIMEVFDFDFSTGIVSNPITDSIPIEPGIIENVYGCSFSPDNSKFYIAISGLKRRVFQYDLNAGNQAAILLSRVDVLPAGLLPGGGGAIQNGPDGKMYLVGQKQQPILDVIQNPNDQGVACNYVANAQNLGAGLVKWGLPNFPENMVSPVGNNCTPLNEENEWFFLPNAFTPNDDGLNDEFVIDSNIQLKYFSVFNRYGERVFHTIDINKSWDGTYHGDPCDIGVYFYLLEYIDSSREKKVQKGNIHLIR